MSQIIAVLFYVLVSLFGSTPQNHVDRVYIGENSITPNGHIRQPELSINNVERVFSFSAESALDSGNWGYNNYRHNVRVYLMFDGGIVKCDHYTRDWYTAYSGGEQYQTLFYTCVEFTPTGLTFVEW